MLQNTSTKVLKSLPGGIWDTYAASGWGPNGDHAFMEFDYGRASRDNQRGPKARVISGEKYGPNEAGTHISSQRFAGRTRDLFQKNSCAWTRYYRNNEILERVGLLYAEDYRIFGWYSIKYWINRLDACAAAHL